MKIIWMVIVSSDRALILRIDDVILSTEKARRLRFSDSSDSEEDKGNIIRSENCLFGNWEQIYHTQANFKQLVTRLYYKYL